MINRLDRRLRALEAQHQRRVRSLSPEEQRTAMHHLLMAEGLGEAEAVARFGSVPAFVHYLMTRPSTRSVRHTGSAREYYLAMLDG